MTRFIPNGPADQPRSPPPAAPGEALGALSAVLDRDSQEHSATRHACITQIAAMMDAGKDRIAEHALPWGSPPSATFPGRRYGTSRATNCRPRSPSRTPTLSAIAKLHR
jgi:hypothetical protein